MSARKGPTKRRPTPRTLDGIPGTVEHGFREQPIVEIQVPEQTRRAIAAAVLAAGMTPSKGEIHAFRMGHCNILVAREPAGVNRELLWHMSVSTPSRHPSWDEIKVARYRLLPHDVCFAILLPPPGVYVNVEAQDHVFHVWESADPREPWSGR